jgi:hypothetical protein
MSWLYLPGQAADCLPQNGSWGGRRFVMWKKPTTPLELSKLVFRTACLMTRQYGMTQTPSTGNPGVDQWISSLQDSRVNLSRSPEKDREKPILETDGPLLSELLMRYDPNLSCWKIPQLSLLTNTLELYSGDWPRQGTMRNGTVYQRKPLERLTSEKGYGLWPTPRSADANGTGVIHGEGGMDLRTASRFPTPKSRDWRTGHHSGKRRKAKNGKYHCSDLNDIAAPGGLLNPEWVEWLMGWPIGWTELKPLEMDRFQQWLKAHGLFYQKGEPDHEPSF